MMCINSIAIQYPLECFRFVTNPPCATGSHWKISIFWNWHTFWRSSAISISSQDLFGDFWYNKYNWSNISDTPLHKGLTNEFLQDSLSLWEWYHDQNSHGKAVISFPLKPECWPKSTEALSVTLLTRAGSCYIPRTLSLSKLSLDSISRDSAG